LHAGDIEADWVLDELEVIAPVIAVSGNMDMLLRQLPHKRELQLANHWIGLIHGSGGPRNQIREKIRKEFKRAELIIYGHTHLPFWGEEGGIKFMNPGSPTDNIFSPYLSVGLIEITQRNIRGEILQL
jgi:putative phosphoesterase